MRLQFLQRSHDNYCMYLLGIIMYIQLQRCDIFACNETMNFFEYLQ